MKAIVVFCCLMILLFLAGIGYILYHLLLLFLLYLDKLACLLAKLLAKRDGRSDWPSGRFRVYRVLAVLLAALLVAIACYHFLNAPFTPRFG